MKNEVKDILNAKLDNVTAKSHKKVNVVTGMVKTFDCVLVDWNTFKECEKTYNALVKKGIPATLYRRKSETQWVLDSSFSGVGGRVDVDIRSQLLHS